MATLKLMIPGEGGRVILAERGAHYEQFWRFRDVGEAKNHLNHLGLGPSQLDDLWQGREISLGDAPSWPTRTEGAPLAASPMALPPLQPRAGGRQRET